MVKWDTTVNLFSSSLVDRRHRPIQLLFITLPPPFALFFRYYVDCISSIAVAVRLISGPTYELKMPNAWWVVFIQFRLMGHCDVIEEKEKISIQQKFNSRTIWQSQRQLEHLQFHLRSSFFLLKVSQLDIDSFLIMLAYMRFRNWTRRWLGKSSAAFILVDWVFVGKLQSLKSILELARALEIQFTFNFIKKTTQQNNGVCARGENKKQREDEGWVRDAFDALWKNWFPTRTCAGFRAMQKKSRFHVQSGIPSRYRVVAAIFRHKTQNLSEHNGKSCRATSRMHDLNFL